MDETFEKKNLEEFLNLLELALENPSSSFTPSLVEPKLLENKFSPIKEAYLEEVCSKPMFFPTLLTDEQVDNERKRVEHIFDWKQLLLRSTESTFMVENLVIKGDKLSKEAFLPTHVKNKKKCIETSPLREPD